MIVREDGPQRLGNCSHGVSQSWIRLTALVGEGVMSAQKLLERLSAKWLSGLGTNGLDNLLRKLNQLVIALVIRECNRTEELEVFWRDEGCKCLKSTF